ncbi:hypothetical protein GP475_07780 [Corynebacterium poyangense]|uniref:Uncharacterized protein n=1 Tax=Corynebacterium poyangense TaxID=2684405 RepID=A0A7H0SPS4_9CORY|nr:hypothetical protein [Corynebacterium poyangense]QNQ90549.1 hypothetical protein GP475_07780 [Corynebacterium poyangense]
MGFTPPLIEAVQLMTPSSDQTEQQWLEAIAAHDLARIVKIADVEDHTRDGVLAQVEPQERARLENFRERALSQLAR